MDNKKELKEIRFDTTEIILKDNLVHGAILPQKISELTRNIIFNGNTEVEGAVFGHRIEFRAGDVKIDGAVYAQKELYITGDTRGEITMLKTVGSSGSIVARSAQCTPVFCSDINAKSVDLTNAYIAGSIYADEIKLKNCVVVGGVFATQTATISNSIVGTFNCPSVTLEGTVQTLLPSVFTIDKPVVMPGTRLYNLSIADMGALFRGEQEDQFSGRIPMDINNDEVCSTLVSDDTQRKLRSYTVIGKVLAADMIDSDRFNNHFLLTAASLGPQLLRTYDFGTDAQGKPVTLDTASIRNFLFDIMSGKITPREIDATFSLDEIVRR